MSISGTPDYSALVRLRRERDDLRETRDEILAELERRMQREAVEKDAEEESAALEAKGKA